MYILTFYLKFLLAYTLTFYLILFLAFSLACVLVACPCPASRAGRGDALPKSRDPHLAGEKNRGFHSQGGTPIAGWFIRKNPIY